jgi:hypothetical protein
MAVSAGNALKDNGRIVIVGASLAGHPRRRSSALVAEDHVLFGHEDA